LAAIEAVLVEPVRHTVPDGEDLAHDYLHTAQQLEQTLFLIKGKLYGESHAIHMKWPDLWDRAHGQLNEHNRLEREMVEKLIKHGEPREVDGLARRVFDAETHGPTRPHPWLPHKGPPRPGGAPGLGAGGQVLGRRRGTRDSRTGAPGRPPSRQSHGAVPRRRSQVRRGRHDHGTPETAPPRTA
jgi:hypothetical protein